MEGEFLVVVHSSKEELIDFHSLPWEGMFVVVVQNGDADRKRATQP